MLVSVDSSRCRSLQYSHGRTGDSVFGSRLIEAQDAERAAVAVGRAAQDQVGRDPAEDRAESAVRGAGVEGAAPSGVVRRGSARRRC